MYCLCVVLCVQLEKLTEDTNLVIYFYMIMGIFETLFFKINISEHSVTVCAIHC